MKLSTPRWWYRRKPPAPLTRLLLRPLSWLWADVTARRIARTIPADPGVKVICVGNLTMGGVGKTPIVAALLTRLRTAGIEAHGLSRGHGGREAGPLRVDPDRHTAADVGDEPLMLSPRFPIWIARDRLAGARAAADAGAQVVVMDDGHQNPSVKKALSILVVDGETRDGEWPFGDGAVFPAGPMREPLKAGLARANAVILVLPADVETADPHLIALFGDTPILIARLLPSGEVPTGPWLGFAGVGKPWKVQRGWRAAGLDLADFAAFPDHAPYSEGDLLALAGHAEGHGAGLITTEKDWVRLPPAWRARVRTFPIEARFEDEAALSALLGLG